MKGPDAEINPDMIKAYADCLRSQVLKLRLNFRTLQSSSIIILYKGRETSLY